MHALNYIQLHYVAMPSNKEMHEKIFLFCQLSPITQIVPWCIAPWLLIDSRPTDRYRQIEVLYSMFP